MRKDFRALTGYQRIGCEAQFRRTRNPQPRGIPKVGGLSLRRSWATRAVKLNSERRRAKRSPSFVLVVGRSLDPAFGVVLREGGRYSPRGESGHSSMARSSRNAFSSDWRRQYFAAMRPLTLVDGKMLASCPTQRPAAARFLAVVRSWAVVRGNIHARCVPGRLPVAIFSLHASPKGPRTGKAPLPGNISPPCIQNELALAKYARYASEKRRKLPFGNAWRADLAREGPFSPHWPLESYMGR